MLLPLINIGFLPVRIWDILDILIVGFLLYSIYKLLKGSIAFNIVVGIILLYALWGLVGILKMQLLSEILGQFISVGFIALIIIFQPEIRRFLIYLGNTTLRGRKGVFSRFFKTPINKKQRKNFLEILNAMKELSNSRTGALIVFPKDLNIEGYSHSGEVLDADINQHLIESIFNKFSPLHDGAMVIFGNKIYAVSCILPVSTNPDIPPGIGLRHRAALGVSENSDAAAFVISEQTGSISFAYRGKLLQDLPPGKVENLLKTYYS